VQPRRSRAEGGIITVTTELKSTSRG
jgi:hypothetical protein